MDVALKDCPHCGAVLLGDATVCVQCGKPLAARSAASTVPAPDAEPLVASPAMATCPHCKASVTIGSVRCRSCGGYMRAEIEEESRAKMVNRSMGDVNSLLSRPLFASGGGKPASAQPQSTSDDDDDAGFEIDSDVLLVDDIQLADEDFEYDGGYESDVAVEEEEDVESTADQEFGPVTTDYDDGDHADVSPTGDEGEMPPDSGDGHEEGGEVGTETAELPAAETESHSAQSGGDALLEAALQEETEAQKRGPRRRRRRSAPEAIPGETLYIYCPMGHRIIVKEEHRGRMGRCPSCRSYFIVPKLSKEAAPSAAAGQAAPAAATSAYPRWVLDARLHSVNLGKLKLKADSLLNEYDTADIGFHAQHLVVAAVFEGGGAFRAMQEPKKKAANRQVLLEHLNAGLPLEKPPLKRVHVVPADQVSQLKVVQPSVPGEESIFADVPVFGVGRIAVRLPHGDLAGDRAYLAFTLSQYRAFVEGLAETYGVTDFSRGADIPVEDEIEDLACHYTDARLPVLKQLIFYQADPSFSLQLLGWRCQGCGLVVSEDARKKEKIGGKAENSVPKAKCPKCKKPFGDLRLYGFKIAPVAST